MYICTIDQTRNSMAKKTSAYQILSPENYIRQRARNLPLYQCLINSGWEKEGLANIIIARRHINGNITACFYLVDTNCLGIKDTFYLFNTPEGEYEEALGKYSSSMTLEKVDYNLVHNIIHVAWEYAEDIGFKPHKDFLSITQYMLEEDTDDIPIIEIPCGGKNGKPLYVQGPFENETRAKQILNQLEQTLGKGNYEYILPMGEDDDFPFDEDDDDYEDLLDENEYYDRYVDNSFEENVQLFLELTEFMEDENFLEEEEKEEDEKEEVKENDKKIVALTNLLYDELIDEVTVEEWLDRWKKENDALPISDEPYNAEILGLNPDQTFTDEDLQFLKNAASDREFDRYIEKKWGEIPYLLYLKIANQKTLPKRMKKFLEYSKKYPDFPLFKIQSCLNQIDTMPTEQWLDYEEFFPNRTCISPHEFRKFQFLKMVYFLMTENLEGMESLYRWSMKFYEEVSEEFILNYFFLAQVRIALLRKLLLEGENYR